MMKFVIAAAAFASLGACATAPQVYDVQNAQVMPEGKDVVWERLVGYFATNNLSIKTIEKDSGIIAAERMMGRPGSSGKIFNWADCGTELLMTPVSQSVDLNVFVRPVSSGTSVTVNTRFTESRVFADERPVLNYCNSTGALEGEILRAARGG
jgi:hypothetical protein